MSSHVTAGVIYGFRVPADFQERIGRSHDGEDSKVVDVDEWLDRHFPGLKQFQAGTDSHLVPLIGVEVHVIEDVEHASEPCSVLMFKEAELRLQLGYAYAVQAAHKLRMFPGEVQYIVFGGAF